MDLPDEWREKAIAGFRQIKEEAMSLDDIKSHRPGRKS
jgi:hypothetical protein